MCIRDRGMVCKLLQGTFSKLSCRLRISLRAPSSSICVCTTCNSIHVASLLDGRPTFGDSGAFPT
eukprot:12379426-Prorocentrum_lima.AAC.1